MFVGTIINIFNIIRILLNHLVNIPLSLLTGVGKLYIVFIAFAIDMLQATIYTKILEGVNLAGRLKLFVKIFPEEKTIEQKPFFSKFRKLQYFGIFLLASLPVYTGGICAAATLRYVSKNLHPKKSFIAMAAGSLTGCVLWVVGISWFFNLIKKLILI